MAETATSFLQLTHPGKYTCVNKTRKLVNVISPPSPRGAGGCFPALGYPEGKQHSYSLFPSFPWPAVPVLLLLPHRQISSLPASVSRHPYNTDNEGCK